MVNSIAILANCVDLAYFKFTLKRTTADVFHFFGGEIGNDLFHLLPTFLTEYWFIFFIWIVLTFILTFFYQKTEQKLPETWDKKYFLSQTIVFIAMIPLLVFIYRGGFQLKPISAVDAAQYTNPKNVPLVISTPFSILKTLDLKTIEPSIFFENPNELKAIYQTEHKGKTGELKKMNVCLLILESFSKEYIGAINGRNDTYTPFLDSLIAQSLTFNNAYANGKKSIEGIPAITSSIPTWMTEAYISSPYGSNTINSLASILNEQGYNSSFFHGGTNGTMGFNAFASLAGYQKYYGRTEYNNEKDYDGNWGIWDEEFLQYAAKTINSMPTPFFTTIFTLTSHHPFAIPAKYKTRFPEGPLPIHKSIRYSDYALKCFFESAKKMPWYNNTLFVLCADHTGISTDFFYSTQMGNHCIPIIYYMPNSNLKGINPKVTQQLDIMPSVLDYINYPKDFFAFGKSVFDSTEISCLTFNSSFFQLMDSSYVLQFDGTKTINLYNFKKDSLFHYNLMEFEPAVMQRMEKQTKAMIQTYQQSLINNTMIIK